MWIVDDVHHDVPSFAVDTGLAEDGSLLFRSNEPRHKFAAVISWLVTHLIEFFPTYGEAMCPSVVDPGDLIGGQKGETGFGTSHASRV